MRTFVRYLLFQIPGWLLLGLFLGFLLEKFGLPVWAAIGFFVVWMLKDFAMYPIVRRAYETNVRTGSERLIGAKGLTQGTLAPQGYIKVQGELWRARVEDHNQPICKNTVVTVKGADRMTLLVEEEPRDTEPGAGRSMDYVAGSRKNRDNLKP
jgi:membrane protein implicated in regulation of membrane protease activity